MVERPLQEHNIKSLNGIKLFSNQQIEEALTGLTKDSQNWENDMNTTINSQEFKEAYILGLRRGLILANTWFNTKKQEQGGKE